MQNGMKKPKEMNCLDISNHLKIRATIVKDMIEAEGEYVKMLDFVVNVIKPSLELCSEQIEYEIDDGHIRALLGNVTDLLDVHRTLLKNLENAIDKNEKESPNTVEDTNFRLCQSCLGKVFVSSKESFKVYDIYCSNHARSEKVALDVLKMDSLKSTFQKWEESRPFSKEKNKGSTTIQTCLLEPLKYLCRSSVYLKALAIFTPICHPDFNDVFSAYSHMHSTMTNIDASKRGSLLSQAYCLYSDLQEGWDKSGLTNSQGFLTKRGGSIKSWKIRWFTLRSYELKYFEEPVEEKALGTLDLHHCKRVFEADCQMKPNCFALALPDRTYYIYAVSQSEMLEWTNLIAWKIYMLIPAEEKARLALSVPSFEHTPTVTDLLQNK